MCLSKERCVDCSIRCMLFKDSTLTTSVLLSLVTCQLINQRCSHFVHSGLSLHAHRHHSLQGKLDLEASQNILQVYQPRASIHPSTLDFTECPYMWPYCLQPLYAGAQPIMYNATILNGMGVWGILAELPLWEPSDEGGQHLDVMFSHSDVIWPWSGHLTLFITVKDNASGFTGPANGVVKFQVLSPPKQGSKVRSSVLHCWCQYRCVRFEACLLCRGSKCPR